MDVWEFGSRVAELGPFATKLGVKVPKYGALSGKAGHT